MERLKNNALFRLIAWRVGVALLCLWRSVVLSSVGGLVFVCSACWRCGGALLGAFHTFLNLCRLGHTVSGQPAMPWVKNSSCCQHHQGKW